jgi:polar amino acid transport system permease protein
MGYVWDFSVVVLHQGEWLRGFLVTMVYAVATIAGGLLIGVICGMAMLTRHRVMASPVHGYVHMFRCTPLLIQIVWFYYALPVVIGVNLPAWLAAGLGLTLYMGAFSAEIFRAGIMSIDKASGMRRAHRHAARRDDTAHHPAAGGAPHAAAVRQSVGAAAQEYLAALGRRGADLMYTGSLLVSETFRPLEVYTSLAALYFVILYPLQKLAKLLEQRDDI